MGSFKLTGAAVGFGPGEHVRLRRRSFVGLILTVALVILMFPSAASAVTPTRFEVDETVEVDYPCDLIEVAEIHRSFTTFYDQDGNVVRILQQITFEGVITNTSTGETFVDSGHNTAMFLPDFATGFTLTGIIYNIREPREGLLFLDAGRLVVNAAFDPVFQSNMALSLSDGDTALCEALG